MFGNAASWKALKATSSTRIGFCADVYLDVTQHRKRVFGKHECWFRDLVHLDLTIATPRDGPKSFYVSLSAGFTGTTGSSLVLWKYEGFSLNSILNHVSLFENSDLGPIGGFCPASSHLVSS